MKTKTDNLILIFAIIAVAVSVIGMGITYGYLSIFKNKITGFASLGTVNLTVEESVSINFTTETIDWGSGRVSDGSDNATLDTSQSDENNVTGGNWTGNTAGFVVENLGNTNVTFDLKTGLSAAGFIGGTAGGGPIYEYNVTNVDASSCLNTTSDSSELLGVFYTVNTTSPGTRVCDNFQNLDTADTIRIDVKIVIPSDSTTGVLTDTFTATIAKVS